MSLTYSIVERTVFGNERVVIADITFDNSYVTGGEPVDFAQLGLSQVRFMHTSVASGYVIRYDHVNAKLMAYGTGSANKAALTEQDAATNLSAVTTRVMAFGY